MESESSKSADLEVRVVVDELIVCSLFFRLSALVYERGLNVNERRKVTSCWILS